MSRPEFEDESFRCGGCGSRKLITTELFDNGLYGKCEECGRTQEVEVRPVPEAEMCNNCAFRKGSPESKDPYRWAEIQEVIQEGRVFHCHKGLHHDVKSGQFEPPSKRTGRVTPCAGWLKARLAYLKKERRNEKENLGKHQESDWQSEEEAG